jgi:hypothetical protein
MICQAAPGRRLLALAQAGPGRDIVLPWQQRGRSLLALASAAPGRGVDLPWQQRGGGEGRSLEASERSSDPTDQSREGEGGEGQK